MNGNDHGRDRVSIHADINIHIHNSNDKGVMLKLDDIIKMLTMSEADRAAYVTQIKKLAAGTSALEQAVASASPPPAP